MKSVQIRSFSGPYFPVLELNTEIYSINHIIQSEYGKIRTRKTPYLNTFHAVIRTLTYKLNMVWLVKNITKHASDENKSKDEKVPDRVARRCSVKQLLLKISQNSQENTLFEKRDSDTVFSCKFWEVFRRTGFLLNTSVGCFWSVNIVWKVKQADRVEINGDQSWNMFDISKISNSLILSESLQKLLLLNSLIWYSWKMEDCMKT